MSKKIKIMRIYIYYTIILLVLSANLIKAQDKDIDIDYLAIESYDETTNSPLSDLIPINFTFRIYKVENEALLSIKENRGRIDILKDFIVDSSYVELFKKREAIYLEAKAVANE